MYNLLLLLSECYLYYNSAMLSIVSDGKGKNTLNSFIYDRGLDYIVYCTRFFLTLPFCMESMCCLQCQNIMLLICFCFKPTFKPMKRTETVNQYNSLPWLSNVHLDSLSIDIMATTSGQICKHFASSVIQIFLPPLRVDICQVCRIEQLNIFIMFTIEIL